MSSAVALRWARKKLWSSSRSGDKKLSRSSSRSARETNLGMKRCQMSPKTQDMSEHTSNVGGKNERRVQERKGQTRENRTRQDHLGIIWCHGCCSQAPTCNKASNCEWYGYMYRPVTPVIQETWYIVKNTVIGIPTVITVGMLSIHIIPLHESAPPPLLAFHRFFQWQYMLHKYDS